MDIFRWNLRTIEDPSFASLPRSMYNFTSKWQNEKRKKKKNIYVYFYSNAFVIDVFSQDDECNLFYPSQSKKKKSFHNKSRMKWWKTARELKDFRFDFISFLFISFFFFFFYFVAQMTTNWFFFFPRGVFPHFICYLCIP